MKSDLELIDGKIEILRNNLVGLFTSENRLIDVANYYLSIDKEIINQDYLYSLVNSWNDIKQKFENSENIQGLIFYHDLLLCYTTFTVYGLIYKDISCEENLKENVYLLSLDKFQAFNFANKFISFVNDSLSDFYSNENTTQSEDIFNETGYNLLSEYIQLIGYSCFSNTLNAFFKKIELPKNFSVYVYEHDTGNNGYNLFNRE